MTKKKPKILIVEDEKSLLLVYKEYLETSGLKIIEALDGEEALEAVKKHKDIDLILLDIRIPKIDGIEVLKKIKNDPETKKISVYLMTVLAQNDLIKKALKMGAKGYWPKDTLNPEQLKQKIFEALKK